MPRPRFCRRGLERGAAITSGYGDPNSNLDGGAKGIAERKEGVDTLEQLVQQLQIFLAPLVDKAFKAWMAKWNVG